MLLIKVSKRWKIVEFSKISIQMKHLKTLNGTQTTSRLKKLPSPPLPHQIKASCASREKNLRRYTGIYWHSFSKYFQNEVLGRLEMVQCKCFSDKNQKRVCWKICKVSMVFGCVVGVYFFSMLSELRFVKWGFWTKLYCKIIFFVNFCWLWKIWN